MTHETAQKLYRDGRLRSAEILRDPSNAKHWFVLLQDDDGKSFILVDNSNAVVSVPNIDSLVSLLRQIGFRISTLRF